MFGFSVRICGALALLVLGFCGGWTSAESDEIENIRLTVGQLIQKYGYPLEKHRVVTEDGYVLTLHRMVNRGWKPPVLFIHGFISNPTDFIITGPGKSIGHKLWHQGYDIWLGSIRGDDYGIDHTHLDVRSKEFWDFSWHEIGLHDVSAIIDYIIDVTQNPQIFYFGHSMGTNAFFVLMSERPEYNRKIRGMFALAPVAYMYNCKIPMVRQMFRTFPMDDLQKFFTRLDHVYVSSEYRQRLGYSCVDGKPTQDLCYRLFFNLAGYNYDQMNSTIFPSIMSHFLSPHSSKTILHLGYLMLNDRFAKYDYGEQNWEKYNQATSPAYDLNKVTAPVGLYYAQNDYLSEPQDVERLGRELPNVFSQYKVPLRLFNHFDFLFAIDVQSLLLDRLFADMNLLL